MQDEVTLKKPISFSKDEIGKTSKFGAIRTDKYGNIEEACGDRYL